MNDDTTQQTDQPSDTMSDDVTQLQQQVQKLQDEVADYANRWKRALADYQNLQKRTSEQRQELAQYAVKNFIESLLTVFDDLEMAQAHVKDTGIELTLKKLTSILKEFGVVRMEVMNQPYDIHTMEAIEVVSGEKDNLVIKEHRAGYLLHSAVLRPAQVTVSKKN